MSRRNTVNFVFILQLALAVYFIFLGIQGIMTYNQEPSFWNELMSFFGKTNTNDELILTMGIVVLASGILMILGLFQIGNEKTVGVITLVVLIIWIIRIILLRFVSEMYVNRGNITFVPDAMTWLIHLSNDFIVLCALWIVRERKNN